MSGLAHAHRGLVDQLVHQAVGRQVGQSQRLLKALLDGLGGSDPAQAHPRTFERRILLG